MKKKYQYFWIEKSALTSAKINHLQPSIFTQNHNSRKLCKTLKSELQKII